LAFLFLRALFDWRVAARIGPLRAPGRWCAIREVAGLPAWGARWIRRDAALPCRAQGRMPCRRRRHRWKAPLRRLCFRRCRCWSRLFHLWRSQRRPKRVSCMSRLRRNEGLDDLRIVVKRVVDLLPAGPGGAREKEEESDDGS
jgi:hypothetical protein